MTSTAIVWFRRDLRVHDHPALTGAGRDHDRVVGVFVLDRALLDGRYASGPRTAFMLGCLHDLRESLRDLGSDLLVRDGRPEDVLCALTEEIGAGAVLWTSDVGPYARARDARVTAALRRAGVEPVPCPGNYAADVSRIRSRAGTPFTVFSPFHRAWLDAPRRVVHRAPAALAGVPGLAPGELAPASGAGAVGEPVVAPGETAARAAVTAWLRGPIDRYAEHHDDLGETTSLLSPYLRWGCISPRELEERVERHGGAGGAAFRRQLAWREFYAHVLLAHPVNVRREFQERYRGLTWDDDGGEALRAWQEGRTGYPLVDAAMRELAGTGWMHNRARLVVGSFLTKDLHIDWREGEAWFARLLLDGEPAQNNGNWQWVASVGVDPAPYFRRLFNPTLQQRKFDPSGAYVRRWVPELAGVPLDRLFEPWTMSDAEQEAAGCVVGRDYPEPIVDHAVERRVAIDRYGNAGLPRPGRRAEREA